MGSSPLARGEVVHERYGEVAQRFFEDMPEKVRASLLGVVRMVLAEEATRMGIPVDEFVTSELVNEIALDCCRISLANSAAVIEEFVTGDDLERVYEEEQARLSSEYQDQVPEEMLIEAMVKRLKLEKPQAFNPRQRRIS